MQKKIQSDGRRDNGLYEAPAAVVFPFGGCGWANGPARNRGRMDRVPAMRLAPHSLSVRSIQGILISQVGVCQCEPLSWPKLVSRSRK
jgi:hypothetical protein